MYKKRIIETYAPIIPLLLGLILFFIFVGHQTLDTSNIAWLQLGDPAQNYLSWAFFRADKWQIPPGSNPEFGLDISNSIVYAGTIPVMAFLFKGLTKYLTEPFQYTGIWLLLCFLLQSVMGWKIGALITRNIFEKSLITIILTAAPPLLFRINLHNDLACHFIILSALYLSLKTNIEYRHVKWFFLIIFSCSVHFYFLLMIIPIFLSDLMFQNHTVNRDFLKGSAAYLTLTISALFLLFWLYGYFTVTSDSLSAAGFGSYKMNILSPLNPMGWSHLFGNLYNNANTGDYEGFNYLGLGLIFLIFANINVIKNNLQEITRKIIKHNKALIFSIALLTLFSISNNIGIGPLNLHIPIPILLENTLGIARASGRFFWPAWYSAAIFILWITVKYQSRRAAIFLLFFSAALQIIDSSAGWMPIYKAINNSYGSKFSTPLIDPFWNDASRKYQKLVKIPLRQPTQMYEKDWSIFSNYAINNQMGTNFVLLSRYDSGRLSKAKTIIGNSLITGSYDQNTLYIVEDDLIGMVNMSLKSKDDLFVRVNNFNVLAPGWLKCKDCPPIKSIHHLTFTYPEINSSDVISFNRESKGTFFLLNIGDQSSNNDIGWAYPESWGTWLAGSYGEILLPVLNEPVSQINLSFRSLINPNKIRFYINGELAKPIIQQFDENIYTAALEINPSQKSQGFIQIRINPISRISPKSLGLSEDVRQLSLGIIALTLH